MTDRAAPLPRLKRRFAVIAHRGGGGLAPENTLAAFRNALRLGADYIEIDVRTTRDGQFVLMHDRSVDRTTDGRGAVKDLAFDEIRRLDAGSKFRAAFARERVPTLDETLALCRGKIHVYLDHKDAPVADLWERIRRHRMERQVVVYAGVETLQEWKRRAPRIPVMPSLPDEFRREGGIAAFKGQLAAEALDGGADEWSAELVAQAHAAGSAVYVDCLGAQDTPEGYRRALSLGVDGIQTDWPDRLLTALAEKPE